VSLILRSSISCKFESYYDKTRVHLARAGEMLTRSHRRDSISLTGPFRDPEGLVDLQPIASDAIKQSMSGPIEKPPAMSIKYRFTITYTGWKAARLVPGDISDKAVSSIFKADLRAFKINQPKNETISLDGPGSVSFMLMRYEGGNNNNVYRVPEICAFHFIFADVACCGRYTRVVRRW
jgi:hypothetical protein